MILAEHRPFHVRLKPLGPTNPIRAQVSRRYLHEHYPIHEQRILGAADAYGVAEADATFIGLP